MKRQAFLIFLLATAIPAIALGSPATDRIYQSMSQPLTPKTSVTRFPVDIQNTLGQSDAMTRTQYILKENNNRPTQFGRYGLTASTALGSEKPVDW